jgi:predicted nucleic acid-binding protein
VIILDTSTLILLAKIELLPLLAEKTELKITQEVQDEALFKPKLYDARVIAEMLHRGTIQVAKGTHGSIRQQIQNDFGLGPGEASALLLAREMNAPLATDDGLAIKAAKIMGIPFLTSIHVVTELYVKSRISQKTALVKLERLEEIGRYSLQIMEDARKSIK